MLQCQGCHGGHADVMGRVQDGRRQVHMVAAGRSED